MNIFSNIPTVRASDEVKEQFKRFKDLSRLAKGIIFITPKAHA